MEVVELDTSDRRQANEFLGLPFRLYEGVPQWVPPLSSDARRMLDRKRNPYYDQNQAVFYLARDDSGQPLGRLAVLDNERYNRFNKERTAFFYLFECIQDLQAAQALFAAGRDWARERGLDRLIGPKGFTVFDGIGMLVKGFEHRPAFGLPYNLPYYPGLVEACGFQAAGELVSGYLSAQTQFPARIHQMADLIRQRRGLQVLRFRTRRDLRKVIPRLKELYNSSLA
ncbi:MAG TPA: hypothetical protein VF823_13070, partial [Anaerolineales bacterium]